MTALFDFLDGLPNGIRNGMLQGAAVAAGFFLKLIFLPVPERRAELTRLLSGHPLRDGNVNVMQVTDLKESTMEIRALMSCRNSGDAFELRCYVNTLMPALLAYFGPNSFQQQLRSFNAVRFA